MVLLISSCKIPKLLSSIRLALFNILLIDYSCIAFRTLGHFPTHGEHHRLDYVSFSGAVFILVAFTTELSFMAIKINAQQFYQNVDEDEGEKQKEKNECD